MDCTFISIAAVALSGPDPCPNPNPDLNLCPEPNPGVDCTFIFISAMKAVGPSVVAIDEAMSMALAEAGPAVTLTSLTSLCAFFLSVSCACRAWPHTHLFIYFLLGT